jgi:hypothetical protein
MEVPKLGGRILTEFYGLWIKPEMKLELKELKVFHGVDASEFVRQAIQEKLDKFNAEHAPKDLVVEVLELSSGSLNSP